MKFKSVVSAAIMALATVSATALVVTIPTAVFAEDKSKTLSAAVGKPLQEAQTLLKANNAKDALPKIQEADAVSGKTPYETYVIAQMKVAAYAQLNDLPNLAQAADAAVATGEGTPSEIETYRKAAAQAYLQTGNTAKFAEFAKGDTEMQVVLADTYLKNGNYAQAAQTMKDVIAASGSNAKEEWQLVLYDAERKSGDQAAATATIEALLKTHPKPEYWQYVMVGLLNQKGLSAKQRLDVYRLGLATGALTEPKLYTSMAQIALAAKSPGDAKRALDKGFKDGVLGAGQKSLLAEANAKNSADLKILPSIESQAASQGTGEALASIADSYLANGQFEKAAGLYQNAIAKGGLPDPAAAKLHLGMALAGAKQSERARQVLSSVSGSFNRELASLWAITLQ